MKPLVYFLNAILIAMAICGPPLFYIGSMILLGFGHGSPLFYVMYGRVGFILPSIAAILACYKGRMQLYAAAVVAMICVIVYVAVQTK